MRKLGVLRSVKRGGYEKAGNFDRRDSLGVAYHLQCTISRIPNKVNSGAGYVVTVIGKEKECQCDIQTEHLYGCHEKEFLLVEKIQKLHNLDSP